MEFLNSRNYVITNIFIIAYFLSIGTSTNKFTLELPNSADCSLVKKNNSGTSPRYDINCRKDIAQMSVLVLSVTIIPEERIRLECYRCCIAGTNYELLSGLQVGSIPIISFHNCPLPSKSFKETTESMGVNVTNTLAFRSYYEYFGQYLEKKHMEKLGRIKILDLSQNGFMDLPEDLFQDLVNLTKLDLSGNKIGYLHKNIFNFLSNLTILDLSKNRLSRLKVGIFQNLTKLQALYLQNNELEISLKTILSGLTSLEVLDISSNKLSKLLAEDFQDLENLSTINMQGNNFSLIPENIFRATMKLQALELSNNNQPLTLPDYFVANLTQLKQVNLKGNNLSSIPENAFWNSLSITSISLLKNSLKTIPKTLFRNQIELTSLDLSENQLERIHDFSFQNLSRLQYLYLKFNFLQNLTSHIFEGLKSLEYLDLDNNQLNYLDVDAFKPLRMLKTAKLSYNRLTLLYTDRNATGDVNQAASVLKKVSPFQYCHNLEELILVNNSIGQIFNDLRLLKLRNLNISYNKFQRVLMEDIYLIADYGNISVDLRHNNISTIYFQGINIDSALFSKQDVSQFRRNFVKVYLEENPLNCDCNAYELIQYLKNPTTTEGFYKVELVADNITCHNLEGRKAKHADLKNLTCPLKEDSCPPGCEPKTKYGCPPECECYFRRIDYGLIVNCTDRKMTELPSTLPRVKFKTNHTELMLNGNKIKKLLTYYEHYEEKWHPTYLNVTHLYLSNNMITDTDGFLPLKLEVLTLDNNKIEKLHSRTADLLRNSTTINRLTLHNNPWACDCSSEKLLNLTRSKRNQINFIQNVTCASNSKPLNSTSFTDVCNEDALMTERIISYTAISAIGFLLTITALYYRFQQEIKIWMYYHGLCLRCTTEEELDRDKNYDAFISYSHRDENFVLHTLVPELESGEPSYKLCLHFRDWIVGEWIPRQILQSVEDSRRSLFVLSPNFLESVWARLEFRAAHQDALRKRRTRVIVIIYEDVGPVDELDIELRHYISMNTYIRWGDPLFWERLRYALPHRSEQPADTENE